MGEHSPAHILGSFWTPKLRLRPSEFRTGFLNCAGPVPEERWCGKPNSFNSLWFLMVFHWWWSGVLDIDLDWIRAFDPVLEHLCVHVITFGYLRFIWFLSLHEHSPTGSGRSALQLLRFQFFRDSGCTFAKTRNETRFPTCPKNTHLQSKSYSIASNCIPNVSAELLQKSYVYSHRIFWDLASFHWSKVLLSIYISC